MSLSATLSSALSGLTAASRAADIVSSNVANAMTEGYARRSLELSARMVGTSSQGVQIDGVSRRVNQTLLSDVRVAKATSADRSVKQDFLKTLEKVLGNSADAQSLSSRISAFDAALVAAASRPESDARLSDVLKGAKDITQVIGAVSEQIQAARAQADRRIATEVEELNTAVRQVAELNAKIRSMSASKEDPSGLLDQRQQLIDRIAGIVPLREVERPDNQIALFSEGGAMLLDGGRSFELGFSPVGIITPDMTLAGATLSGLTLNGRPVPSSGSGAFMNGGSLAAHFAVRDELAVSAQSQLDAVARDLVERFQSPTVDPTLNPGDAGLFTDLGLAFDPLDEVGLSQRLRVNAAADPGAGGALWRLRDGLGAVTPGPPGNPTLLGALRNALAELRPASSGNFLPGARSFASLSGEYLSEIASDRLRADADATFATSREGALKQNLLEEGVDTDEEMQTLLQIEKIFAANAKVVQSVDEMLMSLLRI